MKGFNAVWLWTLTMASPKRRTPLSSTLTGFHGKLSCLRSVKLPSHMVMTGLLSERDSMTQVTIIIARKFKSIDLVI
jgi:hypothetical protein